MGQRGPSHGKQATRPMRHGRHGAKKPVIHPHASRGLFQGCLHIHTCLIPQIHTDLHCTYIVPTFSSLHLKSLYLPLCELFVLLSWHMWHLLLYTLREKCSNIFEYLLSIKRCDNFSCAYLGWSLSKTTVFPIVLSSIVTESVLLFIVVCLCDASYIKNSL